MPEKKNDQTDNNGKGKHASQNIPYINISEGGCGFRFFQGKHGNSIAPGRQTGAFGGADENGRAADIDIVVKITDARESVLFSRICRVVRIGYDSRKLGHMHIVRNKQVDSVFEAY